jgi:intein/homing endonuclease
VEALIKEKKEEDNVLTYLELVNLKNASLLNFEELKRKTAEVKEKKLVEENKEYQKNLQQL